MTPQDLKAMREMMRDLNRMLREKAEGGEPDFEAFKEKWGDHFPGAENLDQLIEQMGQQMAAMQSLMQSMSPEQRQQLDEMMQLAHAPGRAAGGADAPAGHEPERVPPPRRDGPALSLPGR